MSFRNIFCESIALAKPRKPLRVDTPVYSRFYLHNTESADGFTWVAGRTNFLMEMMKFLPQYEQIGYAGESSADFVEAMHEFGDAEGSPFWEGYAPADYETDANGNPIGANNPWDNEVDVGPGRGYTRDNFGSWHRTPRPSGDGLPWGFLEGGKAQNLNFHPGVSEFNHFFPGDPAQSKYYAKDKRAYDLLEGTGIEDTMSAREARDYSSMLGFRTAAASYGDIWGDVNTTLKSYGDNSYYQIVMSGFRQGDVVKDVKYSALPGGGERVDWDPAVTYNFIYDGREGANGEGAFDLMLGLLESRRRIFSAMTELFGSNSNIGLKDEVSGLPTPDDQAMIDAFNDWTSDPDKGLGADTHNSSLLSLFLYAQHSLHSILPAFSFNPSEFVYKPDSSDGGMPGWVFSGKDQLAFQRFNAWMYNGITSFKEYLNDPDNHVNADYRNQVDNLIDEFYGNGDYDTQPYIKTQRDNVTGMEQRAGWDFYSVWSNYSDDETRPENGNPEAPDPHYGYVISQLAGMNLTGNRTGKVYDSHGEVVTTLGETNWAVHAVISLLRSNDSDVGRNIAISTQNRRSHLEYKKSLEDYHETKLELQRQEALDAAKMRKIAAGHRADLQKMAAAAKAHSDSLKMAQASSVRAKIEEKSLANKSKKRKA